MARRLLTVTSLLLATLPTLAQGPSAAAPLRLPRDATRRAEPHTPAKPKPPASLPQATKFQRDHQATPVKWVGWEEAGRRARAEDEPIFLVIGFAGCHWCHEMTRGAFMSNEAAAKLNAQFVPVLLDREDYPEHDAAYMKAAHALGGITEYPAILLLTPDLEPYATSGYLRAAALDAWLTKQAAAWKSEREDMLAASRPLLSRLRAQGEKPAPGAELSAQATLNAAYQSIKQSIDKEHGGFGVAPKLPRAATLDFLLRYAQQSGNSEARDLALEMLRTMSYGAIHDHLGGGFHRLTIDRGWRMPYFEKTLHDNASLAAVYTAAWQLSGDDYFADVAQGATEMLMRDLRDRSGAFYSGLDSDSFVARVGPEELPGGHYVWEQWQTDHLIGPKVAPKMNFQYGIESAGNLPPSADPAGDFKGKNILYVAHPTAETAVKFGMSKQQLDEELRAARLKLYTTRSKRPAPMPDDKFLSGWNGLAISALSNAREASGDDRYATSAAQAARFVMARMWDAKKRRLAHRYFGGAAPIDATVDDYALLIQGLLDVYEASFDLSFLMYAFDLQRRQDELFWNEQSGRYDVGGTAPEAVKGMTWESDVVEPSPNGVSAMNLLRLAGVGGNATWRARALTIIRSFGPRLERAPGEVSQIASALALSTQKPLHVVILGDPRNDDTKTMLRIAQQNFVPRRHIYFAATEPAKNALAAILPIVKEMKAIEVEPGKITATAYVCEESECRTATTDPAQMAAWIK